VTINGAALAAAAPAAATPTAAPEDPRARDVRLANEYASESGLHTRRALEARRQGNDAKADEEQAIADRFWKRAQYRAAGMVMPPELRTRAEGIERVNEFRRVLGNVLESFADVTVGEWDAFDDAAEVRSDPSIPPATVRLGDLRMIVESWGVHWPVPSSQSAPLPVAPAEYSRIAISIELPKSSASAAR
jgi:hypothetical protein